MNETAIIAENLTKIYTLDKERPRTFKEHMGRILHGNNRLEPKEIMALNGVSFRVETGEAIGIIGANGSGKSTLLRVLGGITRPTSGKAIINGRVASVLDLGTGFHPDLSGMENIFLSGEMLGMGRADIRLKVDDIIAFSELEEFIDTPVKYYSSGMFVRLAFSVMAHLESDIILMDEVISVGDAAFQLKSFKKMQEMLTSGRTILLVSHNLSSLSRFTQKSILLQNGKLICMGDTESVVSQYTQGVYPDIPTGINAGSGKSSNLRIWTDMKAAPGNELIRIHKILARGENRTESEDIYIDEKIVIEISFWKLYATESLIFALRFNDYNGNPLFVTSPLLDTEESDITDYLQTPGFKTIMCFIQEDLFSNSTFLIDIIVLNNNNETILILPYVINFKTKLKNITNNYVLLKLANLSLLPKVIWQKI